MSTSLVITGASGFLGAAVARAAREAGADVLAVSRRATPGTIQVLNYSEAPRADVLVHLAEDSDRARVERAGADYEAAMRDTLEALLAKGYARVVYASSATLYGDAAPTPRRRDDPVRTSDTYARTKRAGEEAVLRSTCGVIGRLANLYGRGMSDANVLSTILRQIPGIGALEVMDDRPVRDFIWIDDAAAALVSMAMREGEAGIYNVGSGVGTSIGALSRLALDIAGESTREVVSRRASSADSHLVLDISDTTSQWQWRPQTPLRQGLSTLIEKRRELALP